MTTAADTTNAVDEFMRALEHPFKREIAAIRTCILSADGAIAEGIKWNATTILREKKGIDRAKAALARIVRQWIVHV